MGTDPERPPVVLVHGLWMRGIAMLPLARRLQQAGFRTHRPSYRSLGRHLDDNVRLLERQVRTLGGPVHLLGHSLGGVLILRLLALAPDLPVARVILLGAPVRGSRLARQLSRFAPLRSLLGLSVADWLRAPAATAAPGIEIGLIAGTRSLGIARLLREVAVPNDGVVAVAETRLDGVPEPLALPVSHAEMLLSARVARQVAAFLLDGRFLPL